LARDYEYPTGLSKFDCYEPGDPLATSFGATAATYESGTLSLHDRLNRLFCFAIDGARVGFHHAGHMGTGPGSTPEIQPVVYPVDTTPPTITCQNPVFILHQPAASVAGTVSDATSGPATSSVSGAVSTDAVGSFSLPLTAYDVAGNSATVSCSY